MCFIRSAKTLPGILWGSFFMKRKFILLLTVFVLFTPKISSAEQPVDHLIVMVFDQMRPDYIERYNLKNFKRLAKISTHYQNAIVGHMPSVTVMSHLVIPTGMEPWKLPWKGSQITDAMGILGEKGLHYQTSRLKGEQYLNLMKTIPKEIFLSSKLKLF